MATTMATSEMMMDQTTRSLEEMLQASRIKARIEVTLRTEGTIIQTLIQEKSRDADIVFMGLWEPPKGEEMAYAHRLAGLIGDLPTVILVRNASPFAGQLLSSS